MYFLLPYIKLIPTETNYKSQSKNGQAPQTTLPTTSSTMFLNPTLMFILGLSSIFSLVSSSNNKHTSRKTSFCRDLDVS